MENYVISFYKEESEHYPQSLKDVTDRIEYLERFLNNYQKAVGISYNKIDYEETDNEVINRLYSDIEGYVLEVFILYGRMKFLVKYVLEESFEKFRRITPKALQLDLTLSTMINNLLTESKKDKRRYSIETGIEKIILEVIKEIENF